MPKHAQTNYPPHMETLTRECLMQRVTIHPSGCWEWQGAKDKRGQGVMRWGKGQIGARRLFWQSIIGAIPEGSRIVSRKLPECIGIACCNPAHVRLWTRTMALRVAETCKKGHLLGAENVVVENRNGRVFKRCRICRRESWRGWKASQAAK